MRLCIASALLVLSILLPSQSKADITWYARGLNVSEGTNVIASDEPFVWSPPFLFDGPFQLGLAEDSVLFRKSNVFPTGGYGVFDYDVQSLANELHVDLFVERPGPSEIVTQAFTSLDYVVPFSRSGETMLHASWYLEGVRRDSLSIPLSAVSVPEPSGIVLAATVFLIVGYVRLRWN